MLATLAEPRSLGDGWLFEPKLDGIRCLVFMHDREARLLSRNQLPLDAAYPELGAALHKRSRGNVILDGEIVAIDPATGQSSFSRLQRRMQLRDATQARRTGVAVELWLFDCLFYEGLDLRPLPLEDRKRVLRDAMRFGDGIRLTPALHGSFDELYQQACHSGAEGLIAKRVKSRYSGGRSSDWLKLKCVREQEFVIGGWTDPKGARTGLGALLVGYYDDAGALRYAGKVGTGFDERTLTDLAKSFAGRGRATSPFAGRTAPRGRDVHWMIPDLVAQISFSEWTPDAILRHPRFLGLRRDKAARDVRREMSVPVG